MSQNLTIKMKKNSSAPELCSIKNNNNYFNNSSKLKPKLKLKVKQKSKKHSLSKILKDINYFQLKKLDKNNTGNGGGTSTFTIYKDKIHCINKPKTATNNFRYYNSCNNDFINYDNDNNYYSLSRDIFNNYSKNFNRDNHKNRVNDINKPVWNYSYYYNENKKNNEKYLNFVKKNNIVKRMRLKHLFHYTNQPLSLHNIDNIKDDWKKPRMIRILEKNSLISGEIMLRPWLYFPNKYNYYY